MFSLMMTEEAKSQERVLIILFAIPESKKKILEREIFVLNILK